jgi:hypothetical protein
MKAIGIKMVDLQPMCAAEAKDKGYRIGDALDVDAGYEVTYPDGYKSWCPKEVADMAYFKLDEANDGTKILEQDVHNFIDCIEGDKIGTKTSLVHATTITGFEYVETSSCVDEKNFNHTLGYQYAKEKVISKVWDALGFVLQWAKNGIRDKE